MLAGGFDFAVDDLQEAVEGVLLRQATGQRGFARFEPFVLIDADTAFAGNGDGFEAAVGTVAVGDFATVRPDELGLLPAAL